MKPSLQLLCLITVTIDLGITDPTSFCVDSIQGQDLSSHLSHVKRDPEKIWANHNGSFPEMYIYILYTIYYIPLIYIYIYISDTNIHHLKIEIVLC